MKTQYIFYKTDDSFDYNSPFGTSTCIEYNYHGFNIEVENRKVKIETLEPFGHFTEMKSIKTLEELKQYILDNMIDVQDEKYKKQLEDLILMIDTDNIKLTNREYDILIRLCKTTNEISKDLFISNSTINEAQQHIYKKLNVKSKAEAIIKALKLKLINLNDILI